jgi:superfamily I DNA/RNA helicase
VKSDCFKGVEFDVVYIVGISREAFQFSAYNEGLDDFEREREKINRDLLYVAMILFPLPPRAGSRPRGGRGNEKICKKREYVVG